MSQEPAQECLVGGSELRLGEASRVRAYEGMVKRWAQEASLAG